MENKQRYRKNAGSVFNVNYHLVWCPKYRRKVLNPPLDSRLKELLYEKAEQLCLEIKQLEIMPDHVHVFITGTPTQPIQWIVNQLKGYTSRILREEFPGLKSRLPSLWSRSYFCESIGHISEETIKKYIADQKSK